jgi:hypothetical protein
VPFLPKERVKREISSVLAFWWRRDSSCQPSITVVRSCSFNEGCNVSTVLLVGQLVGESEQRQGVEPATNVVLLGVVRKREDDARRLGPPVLFA